MSEVLFASAAFDRYDAAATLPAKFERLVDAMGLADKVGGKITAIKMHLGRRIGYSTIHPLFIKTLVERLNSYGCRVYITDQTTRDSHVRGYTEESLGCPLVDTCGATGKYFYEHFVDYKGLRNIDVGGHIADAECMIDLSHVKGHGACGYGGACKNIAMGCVTNRTRSQIHNLEGGIRWDEEACIHCDACVESCNNKANKFDENGKYHIFFHNCTYCQHCVKVCPTGALQMDDSDYDSFQTGMALCTKTVLDGFAPGSVFYINFLTHITAVCDCWGFTTPALVPDIGVMASDDIVAIEKASVDAIKIENLLPNGVPKYHKMGDRGHLFERLHGKNPYIQIDRLAEYGLGSQNYTLREID